MPETLVDRLMCAGCVLPTDAGGNRRLATSGISASCTDESGIRYHVLDVSRMPPLYRQIYEGVMAERLRLAGIDGVAEVVRVEDLVVVAGPWCVPCFPVAAIEGERTGRVQDPGGARAAQRRCRRP